MDEPIADSEISSGAIDDQITADADLKVGTTPDGVDLKVGTTSTVRSADL